VSLGYCQYARFSEQLDETRASTDRHFEATKDEIAVCAYYIKEAVGTRGPSARLFGNGILRRLLPRA
jgi:hypothetical protein